METADYIFNGDDWTFFEKSLKTEKGQNGLKTSNEFMNFHKKLIQTFDNSGLMFPFHTFLKSK